MKIVVKQENKSKLPCRHFQGEKKEEGLILIFL